MVKMTDKEKKELKRFVGLILRYAPAFFERGINAWWHTDMGSDGELTLRVDLIADDTKTTFIRCTDPVLPSYGMNMDELEGWLNKALADTEGKDYSRKKNQTH